MCMIYPHNCGRPSISPWTVWREGILVSALFIFWRKTNETCMALLPHMWFLILLLRGCHIFGAAFFPSQMLTSMFPGRNFLINSSVSVLDIYWCLLLVLPEICCARSPIWLKFILLVFVRVSLPRVLVSVIGGRKGSVSHSSMGCRTHQSQ